MRISARLSHRQGDQQAIVSTGGAEKSLAIPPRPAGFGSSVNGGELLFLALATCYCNDLYREATRRGITLTSVDVEVAGDFEGEGEPAAKIEYSARVAGSASEAELLDLLAFTDGVAEIQNTVRRAVPVTLTQREVVPRASDPTGRSKRSGSPRRPIGRRHAGGRRRRLAE
jgi:organic hydroperoxide reductase OsmC/OhrA